MSLHEETPEYYKKIDQKRKVPPTLSPDQLTVLFERSLVDPDKHADHLIKRFADASSHVAERHGYGTYALYGRESVMVENPGTNTEHVVNPVIANAVRGGLANTLFESKHPIPKPLQEAS